MKKQNCIKRKSKLLILGAICFFVITPLFSNTLPERYNIIISKAPFGVVKSKALSGDNANPELIEEQQKLKEELAKEAEKLVNNIKLVAITTYDGVSAAGIMDINSKRTFYLTIGQSILGYTLTDIGDTSILLETTNAIANITMSYAAGQPSEITIHPLSGRLSVLDVFDVGVVETNSVVTKQQRIEEKPKQEANGDGLNLTEEVREAVTIKDEGGNERISFRELHRLRMAERKRKIEEARRAYEEKAKAEKQAQEEEARRQAELERILEAEEQLVEAESIVEAESVVEEPVIQDEFLPNMDEIQFEGMPVEGF